jgi:amidase
MSGADGGLQTCYSIVSPAEKSGIVGFKPTRNVISSEGLIHASKRLDTVGLLTRSVNDARLMLREIIRWNEHHTAESKVKLLGQISPCSTSDLKGMRIGIPSHIHIPSLPDPKLTAFTTALSALKQAGATIIHNIPVPGHKTYTSLSPAQKSILQDTDMKLAIESYLSTLPTNPQNIHTLRHLISFTQSHPAEEYPHRNTTVLERADATSPSNPVYIAALARDAYFSSGSGSIAAALRDHACDVLLTPCLDTTLQILAAKAGSPVLSIPMGVYPGATVVELDPGNGMVDVGPGIQYVYASRGDVGVETRDVANVTTGSRRMCSDG